MVKIQFYNQQGNKVYPKKNYTLLSKKGITSKDVKFFYGSKKNDHIVWNEFENKTFKVEFMPYYYVMCKQSSAKNGADIILSNGDTLSSLSSYLTHLYKDSLYANPIMCRVNCTRNKEARNITLEGIRWISKPNRQFEIEMRDILNNLHIKNVTQNYPFTKWSIITVKDKSKYLSKLIKESKNGSEDLSDKFKTRQSESKYSSSKSKNRLAIKTKRVGWLNFDIYAKGLIAYIIADSKENLYIISKEEDCSIFPYSVQGTVQKFRVILNDCFSPLNNRTELY